MDLEARYRGCMVGLAVGDAVGVPLEFKAVGSFLPVSDMVGGGVFGLRPGEWTDDTSMALCLAESLFTLKTSNLHDQMRRYVRWFREGYLSSNGACFDIGNTVRQALETFERSDNALAGPTDDRNSGNGSLMRIAPVALWFREDPAQAVKVAADVSRTTHGSKAAVDACRYFTGLLVGALEGRTRDELLAPRFEPRPGLWAADPNGAFDPRIEDIAQGSFKRKMPPQIRGSGFVVHTLEAALWAFSRARDYSEGLLEVVNLGEDSDTTGCVYGALAGAYWGVEAIPAKWRAKIAKRVLIERYASELLKH